MSKTVTSKNILPGYIVMKGVSGIAFTPTLSTSHTATFPGQNLLYHDGTSYRVRAHDSSGNATLDNYLSYDTLVGVRIKKIRASLPAGATTSIVTVTLPSSTETISTTGYAAMITVRGFCKTTTAEVHKHINLQTSVEVLSGGALINEYVQVAIVRHPDYSTSISNTSWSLHLTMASGITGTFVGEIEVSPVPTSSSALLDVVIS